MWDVVWLGMCAVAQCDVQFIFECQCCAWRGGVRWNVGVMWNGVPRRVGAI